MQAAGSEPDRRNIVIFCDGTWNSPEEEQFGQPTPTNVHKLYRACEDEAESDGHQVTWYQPGVGSGGGALKRMFEGATGTGTSDNIKRAYAAIAVRYRGPQDCIFLIGFSRGAFAARSVAGMIQKVGLLKTASKSEVDAAFAVYRNARNEADPRAVAHRARDDVHRDVRVHAIGVWDTVGSLGVAMWGWSFNFRAIWRNSFHRLSPNLVTDHVFHALAIDEKRTSFIPTLWHDIEDPGSLPPGVALSRPPQVEEAWFRGVHSDVGGGYADTDLSDIALQWMAGRLAGIGLRLRPGALQLKPRVQGRVHNSARGPLWTNVATWPRWTPLRTLKEGAATRSHLHESVAEREQFAELGESGRTRLAVGQSRAVSIRARYLWEHTGIVLEPGASYTLSAGGYWQDWRDAPVGPIGQEPEAESGFKRLGRRCRRAREARWMALIALPCADFGWRWRELGIGAALKYLLLEDPVDFTRQLRVVGAGATLSVDKESMLWCFANDAWKFYENNTGSVVLRVQRTG
jgi:uncharacterized protein (DUF2235 family)